MKEKLLTSIVILSCFLGGVLLGDSLLTKRPFVQNVTVNPTETVLGAEIPTAIALFETSLANSITDSATTMTLVSASTKDGTTLSGTYGFIIDEGLTTEEFVTASCTGTACTGLTRGISVINGTSTVSALKKAHRRGASVKITDAPQILILSRILNGDETIPNLLSYDATKCTAGSASTSLCDKGYVDALTNQGAATSTESVAGIAELATQLQMASSTDLGVDNPLVLQAKYATSSSPLAGHWAVITDITGKIAQSFINLASDYVWTGSHTFSGPVAFSTETTGANSVVLTASTTITGGTYPQPVYIATSTSLDAGGVLIANASTTDTSDFIGFAISNSSTGTNVYVQKDGIVSGFTGLTKGSTYYLTNTATGTISTTMGNVEVKVGTAISATELLLQRGEMQKVGVATLDGSQGGANYNGTTTIPFGTRFIIISSTYSGVGTGGGVSQCHATLAIKGPTSVSCLDATGGTAEQMTYSIVGNNLIVYVKYISSSASLVGTANFYK